MSTSPSHARFDAELLRGLFDRIYVINLADRTDRLREIADQLELIGLGLDNPLVHLFPGVRPTDRGDFRSVGARGCFLSHLGVLQDAVANKASSILILEDDVDWTRAALLPNVRFDAFATVDWSFVHGGCDDARPKDGNEIKLQPLVPGEDQLLGHFIAMRGATIELASRYLEAILSRPPGSPDGGPMDVDGAYSWLRKDHPEIASYICVPAIAEQRSSRSNISETTGWRSTKLADHLRALVRPIRKKLRG